MSLLINFLLVIHVLVSLLMILMILMQRPKSEGLGAAFGGGVTENIFGAQTTNVLTKITGWLAGIFFTLTLIISVLYAHKTTVDSAYRRELMKMTAPAAGASALPKASAAPGASPAGSAAPSSTASAAVGASASPAPAALQAAPANAPSVNTTPAAPNTAGAAVGIVPPASAPLLPTATPAASASPAAK